MNVLGFDYPDYSNPTTNIKAGEKRKRCVKLTGKRASKRKSREILMVVTKLRLEVLTSMKIHYPTGPLL
jgi:hypothetical protein